MDEYGCFNLSGIPELCEHLKELGSVTFPYSGDNCTAFILTIAGPISQLGIMPWGGKVEGMYLVALKLRGADYFNFHSDSVLHPNYISEKLDLGGSDAEVIAELLNEIKKWMKT